MDGVEVWPLSFASPFVEPGLFVYTLEEWTTNKGDQRRPLNAETYVLSRIITEQQENSYTQNLKGLQQVIRSGWNNYINYIKIKYLDTVESITREVSEPMLLKNFYL